MLHCYTWTDLRKVNVETAIRVAHFLLVFLPRENVNGIANRERLERRVSRGSKPKPKGTLHGLLLRASVPLSWSTVLNPPLIPIVYYLSQQPACMPQRTVQVRAKCDGAFLGLGE